MENEIQSANEVKVLFQYSNSRFVWVQYSRGSSAQSFQACYHPGFLSYPFF